MNKVILQGRLGGDPDVKYTTEGKAVANFSLATSEKWKDKDGQKQEKTDWHKIVAFSKLGEICGQYLNKGSQILVEGKIQTRSWDDKEGNKRYVTEIVISTLEMLGGGTRTQAKGGNEASQSAPPANGDVPF